MKKLSLIFPPPSEEYTDVVWSVTDAPHPPQTASAELGAYIQHYSSTPVDIQIIGPQNIISNITRNYTIEEISKLCTNANIVGLTCWYNNQETALKIAEKIKQSDPTKTIILGGHNISNKWLARLVLTKYPAVDYVVLGDGEEALTLLVEEKSPLQISNLAYRHNNSVQFNPRKSIDLNAIPLWDYRNVVNATNILESYNYRTSPYQQLVQQTGRPPGKIGLFSQRGCPKALGEIGQMKGQCKYCTSSGMSKGKMHPDNFWSQLELLYHQYGIKDYFLADDVFGTNLIEVQQFHNSRKKFAIPDDIQFRGYTYPSIIMSPDGQAIAHHLRDLGITNMFVGVETLDAKVSVLANKDPAPFDVVERTVQILGEANIDTFIPFMPGLPGESKESLHRNLIGLEQLLQKYSAKEYGKGRLTRIDISPAMPLVGTAWHAQLMSNPVICEEYKQRTNKIVSEDPTPNFDVLRALSLQHYSTVTEVEVRKFELAAKKMCAEYMKPEMVGGYDLKRKDMDLIININRDQQ